MNRISQPIASASRRRLLGLVRRASMILGVTLFQVIGHCGVSRAAAPRPLPKFERVVIDDKFPGAYQVEVADVNGDGKLDIVALGGGTCAWYENPTWKKRVVSDKTQTPGIISSATADLDGDGKAEIAIAHDFVMTEPTKGKLSLAHPGKTWDEPWKIVKVDDVPSIHRLRWRNEMGNQENAPSGPSKGDSGKKRELIIAPIFGRSASPPLFNQEPAQLLSFDVVLPDSETDRAPTSHDSMARPRLTRGKSKLSAAPVIHAIEVIALSKGAAPSVLAASNLGVSADNPSTGLGSSSLSRHEQLVAGKPGDAPKRGASEVHLGRLKDGRRFLATVEPWHGTDVAIYLSESESDSPLKFGSRNVIDNSLLDGHALWVADVNGDGNDEVFAGYRGKGTSLIGYHFDGEKWNRTVMDTAIAAQDLRGGDLNDDGTPDIVGVGGATHNVVLYQTLNP